MKSFQAYPWTLGWMIKLDLESPYQISIHQLLTPLCQLPYLARMRGGEHHIKIGCADREHSIVTIVFFLLDDTLFRGCGGTNFSPTFMPGIPCSR